MRSRLRLALLLPFACNNAGVEPTSGLWAFEVGVLDSNDCGDDVLRAPDGNFQITVTDDGEFELGYYRFDDPLACTYRDNQFDCPESVTGTVSSTAVNGQTYDLSGTHSASLEGVFDKGKMVGTLTVRIACEGSDCPLYLEASRIPALPCQYSYTFTADGPGN